MWLIGPERHDSLALQQDKQIDMAWNQTDREKYAVIRERYASELSDEEFALIQPLLPKPKPGQADAAAAEHHGVPAIG